MSRGRYKSKLAPEAAPDKLAPLTPTELQILGFVLEGKRNKEIAKLLSRSVSNITTHVSNIYKKRGYRSRCHCIASELVKL